MATTQNKKTLQRQAERREARINQMLALLAVSPMYRRELASAMNISLCVLYYLVKYAREQNWIVCQGKYYLNPHTVMVAGGKVVRMMVDESCVTA